MKPQTKSNAVDMFLFKYRGILPPLFLIFALGLQINVAVFARGAGLPNFALLILGLFGLGIRIFAIGYAGTNTSGRNIIGHVADSLNTTGIYSICRNPLYLGNFFHVAGMYYGDGLCADYCTVPYRVLVVLLPYYPKRGSLSDAKIWHEIQRLSRHNLADCAEYTHLSAWANTV